MSKLLGIERKAWQELLGYFLNCIMEWLHLVPTTSFCVYVIVWWRYKTIKSRASLTVLQSNSHFSNYSFNVCKKEGLLNLKKLLAKLGQKLKSKNFLMLTCSVSLLYLRIIFKTFQTLIVVEKWLNFQFQKHLILALKMAVKCACVCILLNFVITNRWRGSNFGVS